MSNSDTTTPAGGRRSWVFGVFRFLFRSFLVLALMGLCAAIGGLVWFECAPPEQTCTTCHEIRSAKDNWMHNAHSNVNCKACHGGTCSSVAAFKDNLRRAWMHVTATNHPRLTLDMPLDEAQIDRMSAACGKCHRDEYAQWARSGHSAPVAKFLTNEVHNAAWKPADQCLRCHGMFLEGDIDSILRRIPAPAHAEQAKTAADLPRTWCFRRFAQEGRAAVPCLACHRGHPPAEGRPQDASGRGANVAAFYSRPEQMYFSPWQLHQQEIVKDGKRIRQALDPRRRLCQQCHAANAFGHAGSSDDRTPTGPHEGLSCLACHGAHGGDPRRSCGTCHEKCRWPEGVKSPIHHRR